VASKQTISAVCASVVLCLLNPGSAPAAPSALEPPDGWKPASQRSEIMPKSWVDHAVHKSGQWSLALAGQGHRSVNGCWQRTVPVVGGGTYRFSASYLARKVDLERQSVFARIVWLPPPRPHDEKYEYPRTVAPSGPGRPGEKATWGRIEGWCTAPEKAKQARLELIFRWDADGEVFWDEIGFEPAEWPRRPVRLATIFCRPKGTKSPQASVEKFAEMVRKAEEQKPDFICLPEGITVVGTGKKYLDVAEPIPGPTTRRLGELAREANAYLIAGIYERDGQTVYNTSVLVGRDGRLIGRYRKVALPDEEIDGGITRGNSFPVFETEFGKVGMMICWDVMFPEPARALAAQGAEIVFLPIWGGNQTLIEARAIENQIHLVTSSYDANTAIYDRKGEALAEANEENPIAVVEVDLAETTRWPWLGDYRGRIAREAPPVTGNPP